MSRFTVINACRLCESPDLKRVLDFGSSPLANAYPCSESDVETFYPLSVAKCATCGHVQLEQTVSPDVLFNEYFYSSSDSPAWVAHLAGFAKTAVERLGLSPDDGILEIGCNDGALLRQFAALGMRNLHGVDPAANLVRRAAVHGAHIVNGFFGREVAAQILKEHGPMKLICATNVFAHLADMRDIMCGIWELLDTEGVFVFENAYLLDTVQNLYFDQFYHEHLQYYGVQPLMRFMNRFGFEMFDVHRTDSQGGSIRVFVRHINNCGWAVQPTVETWLRREGEVGLYQDKTYEDFTLRLTQLISEFGEFMDKVNPSGAASVSCYGCPAKFTLLSKLFGFSRSNIEYVVDDSPLKQGRLTPGLKIPIVDSAHLRLHPTAYCIITAWNVAEAIVRRTPYYRGQWIKPLPKPSVIQ